LLIYEDNQNEQILNPLPLVICLVSHYLYRTPKDTMVEVQTATKSNQVSWGCWFFSSKWIWKFRRISLSALSVYKLYTMQ